jgi:hypothetical protein
VIAVVLLGLLVAFFVAWRLVRAQRVRDVTPLERLPLAGFDTGVRSAHRVPRSIFRFRTRGF